MFQAELQHETLRPFFVRQQLACSQPGNHIPGDVQVIVPG